MKFAAALLPVLLLGACAQLQAPFSEHLRSGTPALRACADWFQALDERVAAAGVRDAQDARVAGFPYLRASRLLAALRPAAAKEPAAFYALVEQMRLLDAGARRHELRNLASDGTESRPQFERVHECGRLLRDADIARPATRAMLLERAQVSDDYSVADRFFGLYALTRIPFAAGVRRYEEETRGAFRAAANSEGGLRYAPPPAALPMPRERVALILARAERNSLAIPEPTESEMNELFVAYAPSFEIAVAGDFDRFGALRYLRGSDMPVVDASQLAVYTHPAWTRYEGRVLLQLVYTIWFPERPPREEGDWLAGKLDGVTWRVTLAPDGEPLLYDAIHPCGCFHQFFPTPRATALPAPDELEEWLFAPQSLPRVADGERPLVRLASGTHYIERIGMVRGADSLVRYELRPYADLRSIVRMDGRRASAFGEDGIIAGSERPERHWFWPMGIASAGAMRQWGRHATAFVGRRHFDDADLLEKRFRLELK